MPPSTALALDGSGGRLGEVEEGGEGRARPVGAAHGGGDAATIAPEPYPPRT